jgi:hypothetical protein
MADVRKEWMSRGLYRAADAVGHSSIQRLGWLLEAVQADAESLRRRNPHELADEVAFFALAAGHVTDGPPRADLAVLDRDFLTPVSSRLRDLRRGTPWIVRNPKLTVITSREHGRKIEGDAATLFLWEAGEVIGQHWDDLRECERPDCNNWFAATRAFSKYCSLNCSKIVRNRRYEKAHPPEHHAELRRRAYLKTKERSATVIAIK